jgi:hypothetical protein
MSQSIIDCNEPFKYSSDNAATADAVNVETWFMGQEGNSTAAVTITDGMPAATDTTLLGKGKDLSTDDSFFESTNFIGAFDGQNDWRQGWAYFPQ